MVLPSALLLKVALLSWAYVSLRNEKMVPDETHVLSNANFPRFHENRHIC